MVHCVEYVLKIKRKSHVRNIVGHHFISRLLRVFIRNERNWKSFESSSTLNKYVLFYCQGLRRGTVTLNSFKLIFLFKAPPTTIFMQARTSKQHCSFQKGNSKDNFVCKLLLTNLNHCSHRIKRFLNMFIESRWIFTTNILLGSYPNEENRIPIFQPECLLGNKGYLCHSWPLGSKIAVFTALMTQSRQKASSLPIKKIKK